MARKGIILFGHGSRDPLWHRPMLAVAQRIGELSPSTPVLCAYLELTSPTLEQAVEQLSNLGVQSITIVPLFLGVGRHAREDLPLLMATVGQQYPQIQFVLQPTVGEDARLVDLLAHMALT